MKLLQIGDIHVLNGIHIDDTTRCLDFCRKIADEERVDAIVIPGDIFDRLSGTEERDIVKRWIQSASHHKIIFCKGNHDKPKDVSVFDLGSNVRVFESPGIAEISGLSIIMLPWPQRSYLAAKGLVGEGGLQTAEKLLADLIRDYGSDRPKRLLFGHLSICGAIASSGQPLCGREIQMTLDSLRQCGALFVGLNHIHMPQELSPNILYVGSLTCQDFGEEKEQKRILLIEVVGNDVHYDSIAVPHRRWKTIDASVVEENGQPKVIDPLNGDRGAFKDCVVRYRYKCTMDQQHLFDHDEIKEKLSEAHWVKIVPSVERTDRVRCAEIAAAKTVRDKLIAWGSSTNTTLSPGVFEKLEQLETEQSDAT